MGDKPSLIDDYNHALYSFENEITKALDVYKLYGMGVYNEHWQLTYEIEKMALQLHARLLGLPDIEIGQEQELISIPVEEGPDD
jgi:hypothetical protein